MKQTLKSRAILPNRQDNLDRQFKEWLGGRK